MSGLKNLFKREIVKSLSLTVAGKLFTIVFGFLTISLSAKGLSVEEFGRLALFYSLSEMYIIFSLPGYSTILLKSLHLKEFGFFKICLKKSFLFSLMAVILTYIILGLDIVNNALDLNTSKIIKLVSIYNLVNSVDKSDSVFTGLKEFTILTYYSITSSLLKFIAIGYISYHWSDLYLSIKFFILLQLIQTLIFLILAHSKMPQSNSFSENYKSEATQLSYLSIFNIIFAQFDRLFLYNFSQSSLAFYQAGISYADKIREVIRSFLNTVINVWLSYGEETFRMRTKKYFWFGILGCILLMIVLIISPYFYIKLLLGEKYIATIPIAQCYSFILIVKLLNFYFQSRELVFEKIDKHRNKIIIFRVVGIITLISFSNYWGVYGIMLSIFISESIYLLLMIREYLLGLKSHNPVEIL